MLIPVIAVIGPTASGKSKLAVSLAETFDGEVVSADSRQVYRGLDIGSGKITRAEMVGVRHHLLDVASPLARFSVAEYVPLAEQAIIEITAASRVPIVCGGSGQYVDALLRGSPVPEVPPNAAIRAELADKGAEELFAELQGLDPVRARTIDPKNKPRLIRAIEIVRVTGKPVPTLPAEPRAPFDVLWLGTDAEPAELRARIRERLEERIGRGLVGEVKALLTRGVTYERLEELGLEYRYTARLLQGKLDQEEYVRQLTDAIAQYARRQRTWWRRHPDIHWIEGLAEAVKLTKKFLATPR